MQQSRHLPKMWPHQLHQKPPVSRWHLLPAHLPRFWQQRRLVQRVSLQLYESAKLWEVLRWRRTNAKHLELSQQTQMHWHQVPLPKQCATVQLWPQRTLPP